MVQTTSAAKGLQKRGGKDENKVHGRQGEQKKTKNKPNELMRQMMVHVWFVTEAQNSDVMVESPHPHKLEDRGSKKTHNLAPPHHSDPASRPTSPPQARDSGSLQFRSPTSFRIGN